MHTLVCFVMEPTLTSRRDIKKIKKKQKCIKIRQVDEKKNRKDCVYERPHTGAHSIMCMSPSRRTIYVYV